MPANSAPPTPSFSSTLDSHRAEALTEAKLRGEDLVLPNTSVITLKSSKHQGLSKLLYDIRHNTKTLEVPSREDQKESKIGSLPKRRKFSTNQGSNFEEDETTIEECMKVEKMQKMPRNCPELAFLPSSGLRLLIQLNQGKESSNMRISLEKMDLDNGMPTNSAPLTLSFSSTLHSQSGCVRKLWRRKDDSPQPASDHLDRTLFIMQLKHRSLTPNCCLCCLTGLPFSFFLILLLTKLSRFVEDFFG
ncbi:hypothetical protein Cgig2_008427 [Carnegiea gigantea]|uniref:Uncharacterized protein n=1 Tax=Carnegiea gigantea TaxID=171969 RepID=A0A9Q1Q6F4_9CARY|nr:hypothetical protein Cgig2_008427 [Carnegiea gigantea]